MLVAELGLGTDDDAFRAAYLGLGLHVVHEALDRGIDVCVLAARGSAAGSAAQPVPTTAPNDGDDR